MTWPLTQIGELAKSVDFATGRIGRADARRQHATLEAILERLGQQPGVVLADEVGMGKTFVALGVATLAALNDRGRNPAVVMIPPSLRDKWPRDAGLFRARCLKEGNSLRFATAKTGLDFLRLLDDPPTERARVIFLHHGAFHLKRIDHWTKLALIKHAMRNQHLGSRRDALPRFAARLLRSSTAYDDPELYAALLATRYEEWREVVNSRLPPGSERRLNDDPIPERVVHVLRRDLLDLGALREALTSIPRRESRYIDERIAQVRAVLNGELRGLWQQVLHHAKFRSPLLVLDEAHHLKNDATRLASLFADEPEEDSALLTGALSGRFERMLFLTATPFQLGHQELLNVLKRFRAIAWNSMPKLTAQDYKAQLDKLSDALDRAQQVATEFDRRWQQLPPEQGPRAVDDATVDDWWRALSTDGAASPILDEVLRAFSATRTAMRDAEGLLMPWIIRHRRSATLPGTTVARRLRRVGQGIACGRENEVGGLPVAGNSLLPFLLAARAHAVAQRLSRTERGNYSTFAEGLSSSYEAFLETSDRRAVETADERTAPAGINHPQLRRYVERLRECLPQAPSFAGHPKIAVVVARVLALWSQGEKVAVFCHFRKSGQALVHHISAAIEDRLWNDLSQRIDRPPDIARTATIRFGDRFDEGEPMARHLSAALSGMLIACRRLKPDDRERIQVVVRRFVRTPLFVARYFNPLAPSRQELMESALATADGSGLTLRNRIADFLEFLASRESNEREEYLNALERVQPGMRGERDAEGEDPALSHELLPNVRLANGLTRQEARQRLMLSFNTPFFPDVLVASSVLAEGVDLHQNCRFLIHHDLSWNPSDIEQRTGRVDRLGSKAERVHRSVEVFLPFIGETQDEKQYRVVMDRERWFQVLMGEDYRTDDVNVERLSTRIPLPASAAHAMAFNLAVVPSDG